MRDSHSHIKIEKCFSLTSESSMFQVRVSGPKADGLFKFTEQSPRFVVEAEDCPFERTRMIPFYLFLFLDL